MTNITLTMKIGANGKLIIDGVDGKDVMDLYDFYITLQKHMLTFKDGNGKYLISPIEEKYTKVMCAFTDIINELKGENNE